MEMAIGAKTKIPKPAGVLGEKKEKYGKAFLLGLGLSALIFVPYMIIDGGYFFFYGDFNVQQIPFYKLAHEAIRTGNIGWDWYTDLGANFISSYSFYLLGSPFFWLTLPFPTSFVPYLMGPLFCLKFATATLTSYAYITKFVKNKNLAILGGILYAFSGFSIYNIFFNHFHECIAFFPLLLIGLENYMKENKRGLFFFAVFLNAMVNYIFFFGEVIFLVIYFIARLSTKDFHLTPKRFFTLAFEAVGGFLLASFLIVPSILGVLSNPRLSSVLSGWDAITYGNVQRYLYIIQSFFFPPELPARPNFFPDSNAKWSSVSGWLPLVGMSGVFAYIQSTKKNFIRRILGVSLVCAMVPILNSAFMAFNYSYYARWFYMPILIMALATVIAYENEEINLMRGWRWNLGFVLFFIIAIGLTPTITDGKITQWGLYDNKERFWLYAVIAIISAAITFIIYRLNRKSKAFIQQILVSVSAIAVITGIVFIGMGASLGENKDYMKTSLLNAWENWTLPDDPNKLNDYYRIDVYDGTDNAAMYWHFSSIQAFQSVVPGSIMEFYPEIGVDRGVGSRPDISHVGLRALTSVKYIMAKNGGTAMTMPGTTLLNSQNGYDIYQNENFIPMGFTYENYITSEQFYTVSADSRDKTLVKGILLDQDQIEKYSAILPPMDNQNALNISYESYQAAVAERQNGDVCDTFEITQNGFNAHIDLSKENLVFFSVPYEDGWSAEVDGVPVDIETVNIGFMAVCVPEGDHTITFTYKTPGLSTGLMISAGALIVFIVYIVVFARKDWKKKPSNDSLLEEDVRLAEGPENSIDYFAFMEDQLDRAAFSELKDNSQTDAPPLTDALSVTGELPVIEGYSTTDESFVPTDPSLEVKEETTITDMPRKPFLPPMDKVPEKIESDMAIQEPFEETREIRLEDIPEDFAIKRPEIEYHPPVKKEEAKKIKDVLGDMQENLSDMQKEISHPKEDNNMPPSPEDLQNPSN